MATAHLTVWIDDYDLADFVRTASRFGTASFGYVVTPNVDHLIRYHDDPSFRELYEHAAFVLMDSRFLAYLLRFAQKVGLPICPGSDLTAALLETQVARDETLVLIGGDADQARQITERFRLRKLRHFNPPYGFIRDPAAVEECLQFAEANSPFGYCLIAVGSPQQELLARQLALRGRARGLALCVGASIDFITGKERRAPRWMRMAGLEWLFRVIQNPSRLARRYLIRGPRIFGLLRTISVRVRMRKEPETAF